MSSQRPSQPVNAFSPRYLEALRERDEPPAALDGELLGPWAVREEDGRYHLFREWESFETGHSPVAEFARREDAVLFLAALRAAGRAPLYRTRGDGSAEGQEVEREGEVAGRLKLARAELLQIVNVLAAVAGSPADLAALFEISGSQVQEMAGEILGQEVLGKPGDQAGA